MDRRFALLTAAAVVLLLGVLRPARAHNPKADYRMLGQDKVRVEGWFDPGDTPMRFARVQVHDATGAVIHQGNMDEEGTYTFPADHPGPLRVVVSAGAGHRTEFTIPAAELPAGQGASATSVTAPPTAKESPATSAAQRQHRSAITLKDILVGVGFLLALAAFVLSIRNHRRLRELEARLLPPQRPVPDDHAAVRG
jgi:nickel transport protein